MRLLRPLILLLCLAAPATVRAQAQPPQPSPDEFVPISEIPPEEQIPAINLVATAYGFVWVGVIVYVWSIGRRLRKTEDDLARLEKKDR